jgi:hypothetical protein
MTTQTEDTTMTMTTQITHDGNTYDAPDGRSFDARQRPLRFSAKFGYAPVAGTITRKSGGRGYARGDYMVLSVGESGWMDGRHITDYVVALLEPTSEQTAAAEAHVALVRASMPEMP